jgi:hypothetical protein
LLCDLMMDLLLSDVRIWGRGGRGNVEDRGGDGTRMVRAVTRRRAGEKDRW